MNFSSDQHRALCRLSLVMLVATLAAAGVWSVIPIRSRSDAFDIESVFSVPTAQAPRPEDQSPIVTGTMFDAELWYAPPVAPVREPSEPQPKTIRTNYQLMAITHAVVGDQRLRFAVLYDPDKDLVHRLALGDRLGAMSVSDITSDEVRLQQGKRITILRLDDTEPQP